MAWRRINAVGVLMAACGCASSSTPDAQPNQEQPRFELCAGNEARFTISDGGFEGAYDDFMRPLGRLFLIVDEDCRAWISQDSWLDLRETDLSQEEAEQLSATLRLSDLATSPGRYAPQACFDAATTSVSGDELDVSCYCDCDDDRTPDAIRGLQTRVQAVITDLSARAEPARSALRVAVVRDRAFQYSDEPMWQSWPLETDVEMFVEQEPLSADSGSTVDADEDIALLRTLRANYRALTGQRGNDLIPIELGTGERYGLLVRDELPVGVAN